MRLYAITDRRLLPGPHESGRLSAAERDGLVTLAAEWASLGVEFVQLREKDLGVRELTELSQGMVAAMRGGGTGRPRLLINAGAARGQALDPLSPKPPSNPKCPTSDR